MSFEVVRGKRVELLTFGFGGLGCFAIQALFIRRLKNGCLIS